MRLSVTAQEMPQINSGVTKYYAILNKDSERIGIVVLNSMPHVGPSVTCYSGDLLDTRPISLSWLQAVMSLDVNLIAE